MIYGARSQLFMLASARQFTSRKRLMNHPSGALSGVAAIYNRHDYMDEMRTAQDAYEEYLASLTDLC